MQLFQIFLLLLFGCYWLFLSVCVFYSLCFRVVLCVFILFARDFLVIKLFILFDHALNLFVLVFQMEPISDTQLTANTLQCPTATIMSGNSSGCGSNTSTHHPHHHAHGQTTHGQTLNPKTETTLSPAGGEAHTTTGSMVTSKEDEEDSSNPASSDCKSPGQRYVNPNCSFTAFSLILRYRVKRWNRKHKREEDKSNACAHNHTFIHLVKCYYIA